MEPPREVFEFDVESELTQLNASYKQCLIDKKKEKEYEEEIREMLEDLRAPEYKLDWDVF